MAALSIVIPWCNRSELGCTLLENRPIFSAADAEVIVVNCGGAPSDLERLLPKPGGDNLRSVFLSHSFNKAMAINVGVAASRAERLFLLDADIRLPPGFFAPVLPYVSETGFVTVGRVKESEGARHEPVPGLAELAFSVGLARPHGREVTIETSRVRFSDGSRSGLGLILLTRGAFMEVGGMHSGMSGWGWEDFDLIARLQLTTDLVRHERGWVTHLSHGDDVRAPRPTHRPSGLEPNLLACLARYGLGDFMGTYAEDRAAWLAQAPRGR